MSQRSRKGKVIWFTGLSASGKSTLAAMLKEALEMRGVQVCLLDGDVLRSGLCRDLGFSLADREENIRRAGEMAKVLSTEGLTVVAAFITPLERIRQDLRAIFGGNGFVEVFLDCPIEICESRDPKGLYKKARSGEIPDLTGVASPFETPCSADLCIPTGSQSSEESLANILKFLDGGFSRDHDDVK